MAHDTTAFTAAVIRYRHDAATGEFVNIGVIVAARDGSATFVRFLPDWGRVFAAFPGASSAVLDMIARTIDSAAPATVAKHHGDLVAALREIFPADDSGVDFGEPVSGAARSLARTLDQLYARQVAHHLPVVVDFALEVQRLHGRTASVGITRAPQHVIATGDTGARWAPAAIEAR